MRGAAAAWRRDDFPDPASDLQIATNEILLLCEPLITKTITGSRANAVLREQDVSHLQSLLPEGRGNLASG